MIDETLALLRRPYPRPATVEERLQLLEDRAEITDLIMRYAHLNDIGTPDDLLDLCTDDVVRILGGTLDQVANGKDDLRAKLAEAVVVADEDGNPALVVPAGDRPPARSRHLITDEVIRVDGDVAAAAAQFTVVLTSDDGPHLRGAHEGSYLFEFRREDGRWRFTKQVVFSNSTRNPLLTLKPLP